MYNNFFQILINYFISLILKKTDMKKNCSETALKIVRERVVSAEAQTRTNEAQVTVLLQKKKIKFL